ncbi:AAA family ATPase [Jeotgalibaca arthritidis]|uniref:ATP-binding protein n=1 Tax=Jeotgalibaca arthritidis TaxID=1868794 RepID=UPI00359FF20A
MKIESIDIYGYGKWSQQTFDQLTDLQVFLGDNEAGKSTLSSFIQTIFFGFPSARKKDSNLYLPKQGDSYGGRLFLSGTRFGKVIVERMKDRNRGKAVLTYENGQQEVVDHLASYLLGVDRQTYELLYVFKIDRLLDLSRVKKEDLNRYLLGIGTSGSEQLLQIAEDYRKDAKKEFLPTGTKPPLNQKIKETENKWLQLQDAKAKNRDYEGLLVRAADIQDELAKLSQKQEKWEAENRDLSEAIRLNDYYLEWRQLEQEISAVDASHLPPNVRQRWEWLQEKIAEELNKQTALQEQEKQSLKELDDFSQAKWYRDHQAEWDSLNHAFTKISSAFNESLFLEKNRREEEAELILFKRAMGLQSEQMLQPLTAEKMQMAESLLEKEKQISHDLTDLNQAISQKESHLASLEMKIKELLAERWADGRFKDWQSKAEQGKADVQSNSLSIPMMVSFVVAIIATMIAIFAPALRLVAIGAAVLSVGAGVYFSKKAKVMTNHPTDEFNMADYIQQAALRERLKELTVEEQGEQESFIQLLNRQEELELALEKEKDNQREWLNQAAYPLNFSLETVVREEPAQKIAEREQKLSAIIEKQALIEASLDQWFEDADFIRQQLRLTHLSRSDFVGQFTELRQALILEENMAKHAEEKLAAITEQKADLEASLAKHLKERQDILEAAKVETEAEFYNLLHAKDQQAEQKRRQKFLDEQLHDKEALFKRYPDKEQALKRLANNKNHLVVIQEDIKRLQKEEVSCQHEIRLLEEGGTYSTLLQEYAVAETEMRDMIVDWAKKVVAAEWLEETLRYGKDDRLPLLLDDMTDYFVRLTAGNYRRIIFRKSGIKVQHASGTIYEPFELSQGTVEQLYIAMRFAFIKNTADIANLPILIDDGFVNFDSSRKATMYELMAELSQSIQVFFFTFDDTVGEVMSQEQINVLN